MSGMAFFPPTRPNLRKPWVKRLAFRPIIPDLRERQTDMLKAAFRSRGWTDSGSGHAMKSIVFLAALAFQAATAQVNLGGVTVPKDKFVVFLFIGHSNMAGRDINHSDNVTDPRVWNYHWMSDKQWVLAKEVPG